jgi:hypothetical protein
MILAWRRVWLPDPATRRHGADFVAALNLRWKIVLDLKGWGVSETGARQVMIIEKALVVSRGDSKYQLHGMRR